MTTNIVSTGKIIGYLPGWVAPPLAAELSNAGYTHIIVAFGVFSMNTPGEITSAFSELSVDYIKSLKAAGLKVLLSVGGALTSIPSTTVDFMQVLKLASSTKVFEDTFINSFKKLVTQYGFDGIDIDIEHGLGDPAQPLNKGTTFENPVGDIRVLANIINRLHTENPSLLISLAPQVANVSPSPVVNQTWANYASLIMQTYNALSWVGIQLYNTGGMWGIDLNLYAPSVNNSRVATSPDFSVAMAVNLMENWPSTVGGRATGWLKYMGYLKPEQIVLGYPAPDSKGISDGAPYAPSSVINRATQCLRTGVKGEYSCDTYVPPKTYPGFGGIFTWELTRDRDNNYSFARGSKNCIINNNCTSTTNPTDPTDPTDPTNPTDPTDPTNPTTPGTNLSITIKNDGTDNIRYAPGHTITINV
ncbi:hypothetical protein QJ857_gp0294 [Tupanvirus soda lake]|uniref:Ankyrin repeat protein n=1 Tax=Tupanvirus deep ocean TaxID=2126984 RepID=A0A2K9L6L9_9VIRU|nr:hypothetical protein QJ857_gp0294 [Tupanvirus soda lake]AUL78592.2 hypothetical protein [Tupanvirus soda lake]